jgi:UDP-N-acetylglucosamine--dolichyl-phosphate N-acetylglucosaminephosphotransferase
VLISK